MSISEDVEKGEDNEMDEAMRRMEEEDRKKEEKARQEFIDSICVLIAFIIIISASVGIVVGKNIFFPDSHNITFVPLTQQVTLHNTMKLFTKEHHIVYIQSPLYRGLFSSRATLYKEVSF